MEEHRSFLYKRPHHAAILHNMRLNNMWCDVTIKVRDKVFRAHKVILAASFKYFEKRLSQGTFEDIIVMENVKGADLEAFITYAYTGEILLTDINALNLLEVANHLNENDIKKVCIEFLEDHLKVDDALRAYKLSNTVKCHTLKNTARHTILLNFVDFSQAKEYFELEFESFKDILVGVGMNYGELQQIFFEGISSWLLHAPEDRKIYANELFSLLDTTKLPDDRPKKHTENIADRNDFTIMTNTTPHHMNFHKSEQTERQIDHSGKKPNKTESTGPLMILGDLFLEPHLQIYDFTKRHWSPLEQIPDAKRMYSNSAFFNNKLYYISRNRDGSHLQMFDLTSKRSKRFHSSSSILSWSSLCAFNNFIYLCGGKEYVAEYNQVLRFDPFRNLFEKLKPMRTRRSHAVAIVYQNYLHVLGGRSSSRGVTSVEKYDHKTNKWTSQPSMWEGRDGHAVAILEDKLYACGGWDKNSVEVYDPEKNSWRLIASMNKQRYQFSVVAYDGKLLAIGGDKEMTVEAYYPDIDQWHLDHELSSELQIKNPRGGLIIAGSVASGK